jgi:valyl-tRNA synthetase
LSTGELGGGVGPRRDVWLASTISADWSRSSKDLADVHGGSERKKRAKEDSMGQAMPKRPDLRQIELAWQRQWNEWKDYAFDPGSTKPIFSIDVPPRYVSGPLHIGHAISYTHIDFVARSRFMMGFNVFNPLCFDVNGLPIEVNVEKSGIDPRDVGRKRFVEECSRFGQRNISTMTRQFRRLGHCFDESVYYQTNAPAFRRVTQLSFLEMYEKGYIYRGEHPVNWCPRCATALSDAETEYSDRGSKLHYIVFHVAGGADDGKLVEIATTRPELLSAGVLVAVHPSDARYSWLIGKRVRTPLFDRVVDVVADAAVQPGFGTGVVMICTFGDKEDLEWSHKYKLRFIKALDERGRLTDVAGPYAGLTPEDGRGAIVQQLHRSGLLHRSEPISQRVSTCWRCHTPVEYVITEQWFLKVLPFKKAILELTHRMKWYPEFMKIRLINWTESLRWDWCISRQRYFATPIPVWNCVECERSVVARREQCFVDPLEGEPPVPNCPECGGALEGSPDVFDTWFDSSLTPLYNAYWSRDNEMFARMHPIDLRPQSHDIIRTWAFYSVLRAYLLTGEVPFKELAISGFILGPDGRPMHASWGNTIDPLEVVEQLGAEALRYFAAKCGMGVDTPFNWETTRHGAAFLTKLWNIARFISSQIEDYVREAGNLRYTAMDRWISSLLSQLVDEVRSNYSRYEFNRVLESTEQFMWHRLADYYIEIVKHRLARQEPGYLLDRRAAQDTLYRALLVLLKLFAPLLPHITEEIHHLTFAEKEGVPSIHNCGLPEPWRVDSEALEVGARAVELISCLRKWKRANGLSLGARVARVRLGTPNPGLLEQARPEIAGTLRIEDLTLHEASTLGVLRAHA